MILYVTLTSWVNEQNVAKQLKFLKAKQLLSSYTNEFTVDLTLTKGVVNPFITL